MKERAKKGDPWRWLLAHKSHEEDDCLVWPFSRKGNGYGQVAIGRKPSYAHRMMCQLTHGDPPTPAHDAAHSCGNGAGGCCNPRHLRWADRRANLRDRIGHGTAPIGERHPKAGLTDQEASAIIVLTGRLPQKETARIFGVSIAVVSAIQTGRSWAHLG